ncbi:telomere zinc finger-associated protein isoform X2 [Sphaeramia orbicularis]|uniref:telomere zinc finger-associated protein isoform X2 n=1 Tax=Sphaeramia orbicularis TaxID=375764 RepID=UPI00117E808D|nr:telomere zinc finger-associated protein isoform X2 [Sphaeramia orbicularis]
MSAVQSNHAQRVLSFLNQQRAVGKYCDAMLNVGGGLVYFAHRNILACFSELFHDANMPAAQYMEVTLQDCPSDGLEQLLNFVYTGELKLASANFDKVQNAATSLCVPEVLALCQQFKKPSENPVPVKRKRGRPKKSTSLTTVQCPDKENLVTVSKDESTLDAASASVGTAAATTTTRSGRVVKGPRRLVTGESPSIDFPVTEKAKKEGVEGENQNPDQIHDMNPIDKGLSDIQEEDDNNFESLTENSDDDYDPVTKLGSSVSSAAQRSKAKPQSKNENGEAVEEDGKKGPVQCSVCNKTFKSKYYLKVHNRRHTGEKPFVCLKCGKRYFRKENLVEHELKSCARVQQKNDVHMDDSAVSKAQEDEPDFENLIENSDEDYDPVTHTGSSGPSSSATQKSKAKAHSKEDKDENSEAVVEEDSKKGPVQCPICNKTFKSKYYLKVHNRRHTGEKPFVCLKCGKRYFRKENLLEHESKNCARVQQTYTCQTCSATFTGKEELRVHMISHTGDMPHKCSSCSEQFIYKKNLTLHMMKIHGFPKPHACSQCPKTFLTRTELRIHEAAKHRGEKPFVCEECGHRASSRNGLQMHIKAIHRNERPFVCNLCGHAFTQKNNLNMHMLVHSGERPYQCHLCGKTFRTQASLDKHHRTHTGERPFGCEFCEQRFTEKGALVRHTASKHQEGRPHSCHICGKTFKAREQLRVHLHRHKGMRKFECTDCGYKFTRQAHLRRHIQIHKRTENYSPRQRKLRNVIVEEVAGDPGDDESIKIVEASLISTETDYVTDTSVIQDPTNSESVSVTSLHPSDIVRVVIASSDVMEEEVSNKDLGPVEAVEGFSVSEVLQQTQMVPEAYKPTMDMEGIVENMSENKT